MSRTILSLRECWTAVANWGAIIAFIMASEIAQKFKTSRLGIIFAFGEPLILISVMIFMRVAIRQQLPIFGDSTALFVSSGILPFYVFSRVSMRTRGVRYNAATRVPGANSTDYAIASGLAEAMLMLTTMILWFAAMWAYGIESAEPASIASCMEPVAYLALLGFGVGLVNSAIGQRFPLWIFFYSYLSYGLLFMSGVLFVVDLMPLHIRDLLVWNPITHGIEWFRVGLYGQYPSHSLDRNYLIAWTAIALFLGFVSHRATLRTE